MVQAGPRTWTLLDKLSVAVLTYRLLQEGERQERLIASYFFPKMASLAAFATRNFTTRLAGILIAAPV